MDKRYDVLGLGCVAVDDLLYIDTFPPADEKTRVGSTDRQCGGLTGTAVVAASRLGAKCAYAGVLGEDELSVYIQANFQREGVDVSHVPRHGKARPIHSIIIVARSANTRNIFFDVGGRTGADDRLPDEQIIKASRVLFIDHYGIDGNIRAAEIARKSGVAVAADLEGGDDAPRFAEMLGLIDHLVLSERFALKISGAADAAGAVAALWTGRRQAVVVTCGDRGCWYKGTSDSQPRHRPAFKVKVSDTTGCGDVFHGAYAAAVARGEPLDERVRFASAAAALKATQAGGQRGIPTLPQLQQFLSQAT